MGWASFFSLLLVLAGGSLLMYPQNSLPQLSDTGIVLFLWMFTVFIHLEAFNTKLREILVELENTNTGDSAE